MFRQPEYQVQADRAPRREYGSTVSFGSTSRRLLALNRPSTEEFKKMLDSALTPLLFPSPLNVRQSSGQLLGFNNKGLHKRKSSTLESNACAGFAGQ